MTEPQTSNHPSVSMAALTAAGLDPFTVYRQMFTAAEECCWWYLGTMRTDVPNVGSVATSQVETLMACRFTDEGAATLHFNWLEIGAFRDIATGAVATPWFNPMTGETDMRRATFEDGPAHYLIRRTKNGVAVTLEQARATINGVTVGASIAGARVCLTQTEDKVRSIGAGKPFTLCTTLQIYADLADLKSGAAGVKAGGFYSVRMMETGATVISGLMQKTAMDEKFNPLAWERLHAAHPDFFKGDRVAPIIPAP